MTMSLHINPHHLVSLLMMFMTVGSILAYMDKSSEYKESTAKTSNTRNQIQSTSPGIQITSTGIQNKSGRGENISTRIQSTIARIEIVSPGIQNTSRIGENISKRIQSTSARIQIVSAGVQNTSMREENLSVKIQSTRAKSQSTRLQSKDDTTSMNRAMNEEIAAENETFTEVRFDLRSSLEVVVDDQNITSNLSTIKSGVSRMLNSSITHETKGPNYNTHDQNSLEDSGNSSWKNFQDSFEGDQRRSAAEQVDDDEEVSNLTSNGSRAQDLAEEVNLLAGLSVSDSKDKVEVIDKEYKDVFLENNDKSSDEYYQEDLVLEFSNKNESALFKPGEKHPEGLDNKFQRDQTSIVPNINQSSVEEIVNEHFDLNQTVNQLRDKRKIQIQSSMNEEDSLPVSPESLIMNQSLDDSHVSTSTHLVHENLNPVSPVNLSFNGSHDWSSMDGNSHPVLQESPVSNLSLHSSHDSTSISQNVGKKIDKNNRVTDAILKSIVPLHKKINASRTTSNFVLNDIEQISDDQSGNALDGIDPSDTVLKESGTEFVLRSANDQIRNVSGYIDSSNDVSKATDSSNLVSKVFDSSNSVSKVTHSSISILNTPYSTNPLSEASRSETFFRSESQIVANERIGVRSDNIRLMDLSTAKTPQGTNRNPINMNVKFTDESISEEMIQNTSDKTNSNLTANKTDLERSVWEGGTSTPELILGKHPLDYDTSSVDDSISAENETNFGKIEHEYVNPMERSLLEELVQNDSTLDMVVNRTISNELTQRDEISPSKTVVGLEPNTTLATTDIFFTLNDTIIKGLAQNNFINTTDKAIIEKLIQNDITSVMEDLNLPISGTIVEKLKLKNAKNDNKTDLEWEVMQKDAKVVLENVNPASLPFNYPIFNESTQKTIFDDPLQQETTTTEKAPIQQKLTQNFAQVITNSSVKSISQELAPKNVQNVPETNLTDLLAKNIVNSDNAKIIEDLVQNRTLISIFNESASEYVQDVNETDLAGMLQQDINSDNEDLVQSMTHILTDSDFEESATILQKLNTGDKPVSKELAQKDQANSEKVATFEKLVQKEVVLDGVEMTADKGMPIIEEPNVNETFPEELDQKYIANLDKAAILEELVQKDVTLDDIDVWPVKMAAEVAGDVILGGLMMVHEREESMTCGPIMPEGGVQALEAMLYTLDVLNARPDAKLMLGAHILDDCDKDTYGLEMAVDFIKGVLTAGKI